MRKGNDRNYVSIWFWLFTFIVALIPGVNLIMIFVWAFAGENESRKNYFRALLAWFLIIVLLWIAIFALGFWPEISKHIQAWTRQIAK